MFTAYFEVEQKFFTNIYNSDMIILIIKIAEHTYFR